MREITERDERLFDFLFKFKYATIDQVAEYLQMTKRAAYKRVEFLQIEKYIDSISIKGYNKKFYALGVKIRNEFESVTYQKKISISLMSLEHHLKVTDTFLHFIKNGVLEEMICSEREIYKTRVGLTSRKKRLYKVPDLVIKLKNGKFIAIEVELSKKNDSRMRDIFSEYILNTTYWAVYYLCDKKSVRDFVNRATKKSFIKFVRAYMFSEFERYKDWI